MVTIATANSASSTPKWGVYMSRMKTDDMNTAGWQRVAAAMEARAAELGWNLTRLQDETKISETKRLAMRRGEPVKTPAKIAVLCRALGWQPGSVDAILAGGEPTPVSQPSTDEITRRLDEIAAAVGSLLRGQTDARQDLAEVASKMDDLLSSQRPAGRARRATGR